HPAAARIGEHSKHHRSPGPEDSFLSGLPITAPIVVLVFRNIVMSHVVLLGDSIFDNDRYVPGDPSVIKHLRRALPHGWRATLLAGDGGAPPSWAGRSTGCRRTPRTSWSASAETTPSTTAA